MITDKPTSFSARSPSNQSPSTLSAAIPLIAAMIILLAGAISGIIISNHPSSPAALSKITGGDAISIQNAFRPLYTVGFPPSTVLNTLVIPKGSIVLNRKNFDHNLGRYDRAVYFFVNQPFHKTVNFFVHELPKLGWSTMSISPPVDNSPNNSPNNSREQLLLKRGAADGWYWEVGITVDNSLTTPSLLLTPGNLPAFTPKTSTTSTAVVSNIPTGSLKTYFSVEILQMPGN